MKEQVILVNNKDEETGIMEKMEAHQKGVLHRAFSVFIFDKQGKMLLQQRAQGKYHGALLWTNACCSHPMPGESIEQAAARRLKEEMGFNTPLKKIFSFIYHAEVENGLIEHEYDHVFAGEYEGPIDPHHDEVAGYKYETMESLKEAIQLYPASFTSWFKIAFPEIRKWWAGEYGGVG
jgi:isopentenyl-diphosphate delta-isomerase